MTENIKLPNSVKYIPELFDYIVDKRKDEKIELLRQFVYRQTPMSKVLYEVVRFTYQPDLFMSLPEGTPPYQDLKFVDYTKAPMTLFSAFRRRVPYFCNRLPRFIQNDLKREKLFIQTIEAMFERDVKLFIQVKDKALTEWKGIDERLFRDAFPDWFTWEESNEEPAPVDDEVVQDQESTDTSSPSTEQEETSEAPVQQETVKEEKPRRRGRPKKKDTSSGGKLEEKS